MQIGRFLHAAVLVCDLVRAKQFYGGVLGLKEKARHTFNFDGAWYDLGECELHLIVTPEALPPGEHRPRRDYHVAFSVDDYDATKLALEEGGVPYREGNSGLAQLFIRDPDGNLIELQKR